MMNLQSLKSQLETKGIRQCHFARRAGLAPQQVSSILSGWQPLGALTIQKLLSGMLAFDFSKQEMLDVLAPKASRGNDR